MDYDKLLLKSYTHWDLYLHPNQIPYLGRCYAWSKRENSAKVIDMTLEERTELFDIVIPEWNSSIKELFQFDWPNVSCLGNTSPHCHWHLIPRYHKTITKYGIEFSDPKPNRNYVPYEKKEIDQKTLQEIKKDIQTKINS